MNEHNVAGILTAREISRKYFHGYLGAVPVQFAGLIRKAPFSSEPSNGKSMASA